MGILDKIGLKKGDDVDDFINMPESGGGVGSFGPAGFGAGGGTPSMASIDSLPSPGALPSTGVMGGQSSQMLLNKIDLLSNKIDTLRSQIDILNQKIAELQSKLDANRPATPAPIRQSPGYGQDAGSFGGFDTQPQPAQQQQEQNWQSPW